MENIVSKEVKHRLADRIKVDRTPARAGVRHEGYYSVIIVNSATAVKFSVGLSGERATRRINRPETGLSKRIRFSLKSLLKVPLAAGSGHCDEFWLT